MTNLLGEVLMDLCCWGLVPCGVVLFAVKVAAPAWDEIRKFVSLMGAKAALLVPLVAFLAFFAATKPKITYTDGIVDAGHTLVTNDTVHVEWVRDVKAKILVPLTAPVFIDYRPHGSTNEWGMLAQSVVSAGSWDGILEDATNYDYHVWAYYVPPGPVVTNEVWTYRSIMDAEGKSAIPLRATVEVDGRPISNQNGKDEK